MQPAKERFFLAEPWPSRLAAYGWFLLINHLELLQVLGSGMLMFHRFLHMEFDRDVGTRICKP
jgi:hypothetical protein